MAAAGWPARPKPSSECGSELALQEGKGVVGAEDPIVEARLGADAVERAPSVSP